MGAKNDIEKRGLHGWAVSLLLAGAIACAAPADSQTVRVSIPDAVAREIGQQPKAPILDPAALGLEARPRRGRSAGSHARRRAPVRHHRASA